MEARPIDPICVRAAPLARGNSCLDVAPSASREGAQFGRAASGFPAPVDAEVAGTNRWERLAVTADPIYLTYDRVALDAQYNNQRARARLRRPCRALAEGERARAALPGERDVAFGPSADEVLDIYSPAKASGPVPVQVFITAAIGGPSRPPISPSWPSAWRRPALSSSSSTTRWCRWCASASWCGNAAPRWPGCMPTSRGHGGDPNRIFVSRSLGRRPSDGGDGGDGIARRRAGHAPAAAGRRLAQRPLRSRADPALLSAGDAPADPGGGGGEQPGAPPCRADRRRLSSPMAPTSRRSSRATRASTDTRSPTRGVACTVSPLAGHNHMSICSALADRKQRAAADDPGADGIGLTLRRRVSRRL